MSGGMSYPLPVALYLVRWTVARERYGAGHPRERAAFGRYVARRGGAITSASAGLPAWVAWLRGMGYPLNANRTQRARLPIASP